jgi:multiple sugar transport system permease protein
MKKKIIPYYFLIPMFVIIAFIYLYPSISLVEFSFKNTSLVSRGKFVGVANFQLLGNFLWSVVLKTLTWTFGSVIPAMAIGLGGALLFQDTFRGKRILMTLYLVPYCMPLAIAAFLWVSLYNPNFGIINIALLKIGLISQPISFLSYKNALASVIVIRIWRATPLAFITYYAGLQSIPTQYYEAARVDGAGPLPCFVNITFPQLRSVTMVTAVILTVWTALIFDIIFPLTEGGPLDATEIIPIKIYRLFFYRNEVGEAAALSLATMGVLFLISLFYWKIIQREH